MTWATIAVRHEVLAHYARNQSGYPVITMDVPELDASLVAITGAAFAIDSLGRTLNPYVRLPDPLRAKLSDNADCQNRRTRRAGLIVEVFKHAFNVPGPVTQRWQTEIPSLFSLRGAAVHHNAVFNRAPIERTRYHAEAATQAVDLALEVLHSVLPNPKPDQGPELQAWAAANKHIPPLLSGCRVEWKQSRGITAYH